MRTTHHSIPFFIFLFLFYSISSSAQDKSLVDNYWVERYTKEHGLADNDIQCLLQDKDGFIWIATAYNLVRFDGYNFKNYSYRDSFPDKSSKFEPKMIEGPDDKIWIVVERLGIVSFDKKQEQFRFFGLKGDNNIFTSKFITDLILDKHNNVWVSTMDGLNKVEIVSDDSINVEHFQARSLPLEIFNEVDTLLSQAREKWSLTKVENNQELSKNFSIEHPQFLAIKVLGEARNNIVTNTYWVDHNKIGIFDFGWIENEKGEKVWESNIEKSRHAGGSFKNKNIVDVIYLQAGKYTLKYKTDGDHAFGNWNGEAPTQVEEWGIQIATISNDKGQNIENQLQTFLSKTFISHNVVYDLNIDDEGNILTAHLKGVDKISPILHSNDSIQYEIKPIGKNLGNRVLEIDKLPNGNFLAMKSINKFAHVVFGNSQFEFFKLDAKTDSFTSVFKTHGLPAQYPKDIIHIDRKANIWFGSSGSGFHLIDSINGSSTKKTIKLPKFPGNYPTWSSFSDRQNNLWVATHQHFLYKLSKSSEGLNYFPLVDESEKDKTVYSVQPLSNGKFWIKIDELFYVFDPQAKEKFIPPWVANKINQGKTHKFNSSSFLNDKNEIWIYGHKQMLKYDFNSNTSQVIFEADTILPILRTFDINPYQFTLSYNVRNDITESTVFDGENFFRYH